MLDFGIIVCIFDFSVNVSFSFGYFLAIHICFVFSCHSFFLARFSSVFFYDTNHTNLMTLLCHNILFVLALFNECSCTFALTLYTLYNNHKLALLLFTHIRIDRKKFERKQKRDHISDV